MKKITTLGFIGLGVMGEPMCRNLVTKTKLPVYGTDLKREPVERLVANGLKACTSVAEVARAADLIFLSLHSPQAVEDVCTAIADAKGRTHTIADMSTTPVKLTKALHARLAAHGITLVDAPVAGMRARAHAGTLSIMVGATAETFAAVQPHLAHMGEATHCGDGQLRPGREGAEQHGGVHDGERARRGDHHRPARRHRRETAVRDHVEGLLRLARCCAPAG